MVIAALGDERSEAQLAAAMGSYEFGTPASRVKRLNKLGYQVTYGALSFEQLRAALAQGLYPIVFVRADVLPWADFGGFHAVVLTEISEDAVLLHDPAQDEGPTQLPMAHFLLAWEEFDCLATIIAK